MPAESLTMHPLSIHPLQPAHADALLAFELENRAFFEASINARPEADYQPEGLRAAIAQAMHDAEAGVAFRYLVLDARGAIVGRVNLTGVRRAHFHCADLGYRVAQSACGQGVASDAVRQVLAQAFGPLGLRRVQACARPENVASVAVLRRNRFSMFGRSRRSFELHGAWYDRLYFEAHAPGHPEAVPDGSSRAGCVNP